jgi:transposase, IS5 family
MNEATTSLTRADHHVVCFEQFVDGAQSFAKILKSGRCGHMYRRYGP